MAHAAQHQAPAACWCATCRPVSFGDMRMVVCPACGNKRCPRATDHRYACTGSNEDGQVGNAYIEQMKPQGIINGATMNKDELDELAERDGYCVPFGEAVTLSRAERDALVAMARDGMRYRWLRDEDAGVPDGMREIVVVQFRLPHSEGTDTDLFDQALDAAIDAAMAKEQA